MTLNLGIEITYWQDSNRECNPKCQLVMLRIFSVGTVIAGLNELFTRLYDISFVPMAALKGETWDSHQVRKIKVVDNAANKTLGFLYLDFWSTKVLPSHFTIVCLRRLNTSIGSETIEGYGKACPVG